MYILFESLLPLLIYSLSLKDQFTKVKGIQSLLGFTTFYLNSSPVYRETHISFTGYTGININNLMPGGLTGVTLRKKRTF